MTHGTISYPGIRKDSSAYDETTHSICHMHPQNLSDMT